MVRHLIIGIAMFRELGPLVAADWSTKCTRLGGGLSDNMRLGPQPLRLTEN